ncbi:MULTISPECIES: benzoate 1,2-dioxygenase small subunit [Herbaspirillum]|jgi:benzoate/toluate 1,2-dioxygenase beta subunit|uniref:benzoate 1,2-dioxygenase small subunit n=1 Tax=Herbaspirillum TaxID=963 RepID=UPI0012ACBBE5|nr:MULTISPECIES: benzoate 1,2-dioxygenase small subunit [Herbaspirillum]MRT27784.1 benzoate 1,2-dioxygenase small subunit [Herbaspirillum sp. CAH-3]
MSAVNKAEYGAVCAFIFREGRHLDDREWEPWLEMYAPDAEYWMPAWGDDDQLTEDPQSEISLIYYANRDGLEDRVFRIKTERSSASMPEPRTNHMLTNVEVMSETDEALEVRYNFHTLSHRYKLTDHFFGTIYATLRKVNGGFLFGRKKIVLKNDYIRQVIDVYHI